MTWVRRSAAAVELMTVNQVWGHSSAKPLRKSAYLLYRYLTAKPAVNLNMKKLHLKCVKKKWSGCANAMESDVGVDLIKERG